MILIEAWKLVVLERYAKFDGRAGRAEYWWFVLATSSSTGDHPLIGWPSHPRSSLFAVLVPTLAVAIRRLHDTNKSAGSAAVCVDSARRLHHRDRVHGNARRPRPEQLRHPDADPGGPPDPLTLVAASRDTFAHDVCRGSRRVRRRQSCDGTAGLAREVRRRRHARAVASARARRGGCAGRSRRGRGSRAGDRRCGGARRRPDRTVARQGVGRRRRLRIHRAQPCARRARIRRTARVPDVRRHPVRRQGCRPAVSRLRRAEPGDGGVLWRRRSDARRRVGAVGHARANRRVCAASDRRGLCGGDGADRSAARRRVAHASRPPSALGDARGGERAGRQPHRRRRPTRPPGIPRQRPCRHRLPRRRRERPGEGLHGHPPASRRSSGRRWCSTACSRRSPGCAAPPSRRARSG